MSIPKHTAVGVDGNADLPVSGHSAAFIVSNDPPDGWAKVGFLYKNPADPPGKPPVVRTELVREKYLFIRGC